MKSKLDFQKSFQLMIDQFLPYKLLKPNLMKKITILILFISFSIHCFPAEMMQVSQK